MTAAQVIVAAAGKATAAEVEARARHCAELVRIFADVLALHTDFSLSESLDRMEAVEHVCNPGFEHIFFENSACDYCLSHQAEYARGWYVPATDRLTAQIAARAAAGDFSPLPKPIDYRDELRWRAHPIHDFAPDPARRTPDEFRKLMQKAGLHVGR